MNRHFQNKIEQFYAQKRYAIIGISSGKGHEASALNFKRLKGLGLDVYPVNPNHEKYLDHKCFPSVKDIKDPVGAAVIFTHPTITAKVLKECIEAGIKNIWIHDGIGPGSKSPEAAQIISSHPELNIINGTCPMMFGPPSDFFHKGVGKVLGWIDKVPA